jgi:hypothetical protein
MTVRSVTNYHLPVEPIKKDNSDKLPSTSKKIASVALPILFLLSTLPLGEGQLVSLGGGFRELPADKYGNPCKYRPDGPLYRSYFDLPCHSYDCRFDWTECINEQPYCVSPSHGEVESVIEYEKDMDVPNRVLRSTGITVMSTLGHYPYHHPNYSRSKKDNARAEMKSLLEHDDRFCLNKPLPSDDKQLKKFLDKFIASMGGAKKVHEYFFKASFGIDPETGMPSRQMLTVL